MEGLQSRSFDYVYEGSCEVQMVAPPPPEHLPFIGIEVDGQIFSVVPEPDYGCMEGYGGEWIDESWTVLRLCPEACVLFEAAGDIEVEYGAPPCE